MKKILLMGILSLGLITAQAQFGVQAGVNISSWHGDDADDLDPDALVGFHGGVFYKLMLSDNFAFEPQLSYSTSGAKSEDGDAKTVFSSVDVTALAKWVHESGFFVGTGPQLGVIVSAENKVDGEDDEDVKDQVNNTQFSWAITAGFDHSSGFGVFARYNFGLTKVLDEGFFGQEVEIKQSVAQIGLRWTFNKGGSK